MSTNPRDPRALPRSDAEWRRVLSPEQYRVARKRGTEAPFSGEYYHCTRQGVYRCVCCGAALFSSKTKYDSGSGWPSFFRPVDESRVRTSEDHSFGMERTEIVCASCGAHLGHIFDDGPPPTGLRYCVNSASLKLDENAKPGS